MSESYDYVVGGKLKLKGMQLPSKQKRKKKKKKKQLEKAVEHYAEKGELEFTQPPPQLDEEEDTRTEAEKKFEEIKLKRRTHELQEAERIAKLAEKSHREKILEMNKKLDSMTEHFDIPKVGPG